MPSKFIGNKGKGIKKNAKEALSCYAIMEIFSYESKRIIYAFTSQYELNFTK